MCRWLLLRFNHKKKCVSCTANSENAATCVGRSDAGYYGASSCAAGYVIALG